jgi:ABC-2 type transport system ATP-binding protein
MSQALVAKKLCRRYSWRGGHHDALVDVDLEVPRGTVLGLIGRNGAGKTTFLRIASTTLMPTSGNVTVLDYDVISNPTAVRERIAVIPQEARPFYWTTPKELIYYYLTMRGESRTVAAAKTKDALAELGLNPWEDTVVSRLSGGLRRKAMVAMVMASDADILFLDEPTTGLDPVARRSVWEAIRKAAKANRTIFLTTHYLDEAESLSNRLALLEGGHLLASGSRADLAARARRPYRVTVEGGFSEEELRSYGDVGRVGDRWLLFTGESEARELSKKALEKGVRLSLGPVSLEDIFLQMVGADISVDAEEDEGYA